MPRRPRRSEPATWEQLALDITCPKQYLYELIRPIVLTQQGVADRATETDTPERTLHRYLATFRQDGLSGLVALGQPRASDLPPSYRLPEHVRTYLCDLHAEYPALRVNELATICSIHTGRRPSKRTIKRVLATAPSRPPRPRRFPLYHQIGDPFERRRAIVRLYLEGWNKKSIAGYLETSRQTVHDTIQRWHAEGLAGLPNKSSAPKRRRTKVTIAGIQRIRTLQRNPLLGSWRMHAILKREGMLYSPRTCSRIMAVNRTIYPELRPASPVPKREKQPMPFAAHYRHQFWSIDIRYLDRHKLGSGKVYSISILENYSRAILSSAISRVQDTTAVLMVLYAAVQAYGCPDAVVSDRGGVFRSRRFKQVLRLLGITHRHIDRKQPWQNYIETNFNLQRRLADYADPGFATATTWDELLAAHRTWMDHANHDDHWAHRAREDGCHSPAAVLSWVRGRIIDAGTLDRIFHSLRFVRTLDRYGYARFQHFRLYGTVALAGRPVVLWLDGEILTVTEGVHSIRRYAVTTTKEHRLASVRNPEALPHPYVHPQLSLWDVIERDWQMVMGPFAVGPRRRQQHSSTQLRFDVEDSDTSPPLFNDHHAA